MACRRSRISGSLPWMIAVLLTTAVATPVNAQIQLDRFFPSAVSVGATGTVKAEGKFPSWPVEIVCDRDDVQLSAGTESGTIEFHVTERALPGIAWVRLHDTASATTVLPLLIEREPIQIESEPNNQPADLKSHIETPCWIAGRLEKSGDVDLFPLKLSAGQTLLATVRANEFLRSPMDAVLQLADERGNVLAQADDVRGLDPQFVYRCPADGVYVIRLFAFPETPNSTIGFAGASTFVYLLRMTTDPTLDHSLPLIVAESGDRQAVGFGEDLPEEQANLSWTKNRPPVSSLPGIGGWQWHDTIPSEATFVFESATDETAITRALPAVFSGHFQRPGEVDRVQFPVKSGQRYRATVHSRKFGFEVDSVLRVIDPETGNELVSNDDASRKAYDARTEFKAERDQTIEIQVSDVVDNHGARAAYSVAIERVAPGIELLLPADRFVIDSDQPLELKVAVNRKDGDDSTVRIWAEGLPDGVVCEPQTSKAGDDSGKLVTLKMEAKQTLSVQASFRVVGQRVDSKAQPSGSKMTATFFAAKTFRLSDCWLSVTK